MLSTKALSDLQTERGDFSSVKKILYRFHNIFLMPYISDSFRIKRESPKDRILVWLKKGHQRLPHPTLMSHHQTYCFESPILWPRWQLQTTSWQHVTRIFVQVSRNRVTHAASPSHCLVLLYQRVLLTPPGAYQWPLVMRAVLLATRQRAAINVCVPVNENGTDTVFQ